MGFDLWIVAGAPVEPQTICPRPGFRQSEPATCVPERINPLLIS